MESTPKSTIKTEKTFEELSPIENKTLMQRLQNVKDYAENDDFQKVLNMVYHKRRDQFDENDTSDSER